MEENTPGVQRYVDMGQALTDRLQQQRKEMASRKFDTIAVHGLFGLQDALQSQGSTMEPLYLSPAQHFENADHMEATLSYQMPGWVYSRIANPGLAMLESTLALLESYRCNCDASACVTASGMSAIHMATRPFLDARRGRSMNIVASSRCYGGTHMLFNERYGKEQGVDVRWVSEPANLEEWAGLLDEETRFLFIEMPSNPGLAMGDIEALSRLAREAGIALIVDATVASPALMRPFSYGADIVVHSLSKVIASSGYAIAGVFCSKKNIRNRWLDDAMCEDFATSVKLLPFRDFGPALSPFSAMMVMNDLRSLRSRVNQMSESAMKVARFLELHPGIESVNYPGLPSSASHELAKSCLKLVDSEGPSGEINRYSYLMSFNVAGKDQATRDMFDRLRLISRATDLGRVKSVATIPAISTHQQQGEEARRMADIPSNQVRLSIGLEDPDDLLADLEQALRA